MKLNKSTIESLSKKLDQLKALEEAKAKAKAKTKVTQLQQAIAQELKTSPTLANQTVEIKDTKNGIFYRASSFTYLYFLSLFAFLFKKLPLTSRITTSLYNAYGKTSFWSLLVLSRKAFVIFNALLGMYAVVKASGAFLIASATTGINSYISSLTAVGKTYANIIWNSTKDVLNWAINLFNYKLIPNEPKNPSNHTYGPWNGPGWNTKPVIKNNIMDVAESSKDWYRLLNQPEAIERSWYQEPSFWLYLIGGTVAVITVVGVGMLAYSYYMELNATGDTIPKIITPKGKGTLPVDKDLTPTQSPTDFIQGSSKDVTNINQAKDIFDETPSLVYRMGNSILSGLSDIKSGISKLNPINLFTSNESREVALNNFLEQQSSSRFNHAFYPFTANNPYASAMEKLRIHILGETASERLNRFMYKQSIINSLIPNPNIGSDAGSFISDSIVGPRNLFITDWASEVNATATRIKLDSLPGTPTITPNTPLPKDITDLTWPVTPNLSPNLTPKASTSNLPLTIQNIAQQNVAEQAIAEKAESIKSFKGEWSEIAKIIPDFID